MHPHFITRHSHYLLLAVLFQAVCTTGVTASTGVPETGDRVQHYDIYREGKHIGTHTIRHTRQADMVMVEARTRISIRLLGFEVYRFRYDAREAWDVAGLLQLVASVDDDGEQLSLEGQRQGDRFVWSDGRTQRSLAMPVYPTNHWNNAVLGQEVVLNTLTGQVNQVTIHHEGEDTLEFADSSLTAIRYRYDGQLQLESWYDRAGRWLAMRFVIDDGSTIRYQCSNCETQARL